MISLVDLGCDRGYPDCGKAHVLDVIEFLLHSLPGTAAVDVGLRIARDGRAAIAASKSVSEDLVDRPGPPVCSAGGEGCVDQRQEGEEDTELEGNTSHCHIKNAKVKAMSTTNRKSKTKRYAQP
jgi:hypothetical protein